MPYFYLQVVRGIDSGRRYELHEGTATVGRAEDSAVQLPNDEKAVSAHHAVLYVSASEVLVQDFESTNGTFLNNNRISGETPIQAGDTVGFGKTGPRLELIVSPERLSLDGGRDDEAADAEASRDIRADEQPSVTAEYERKLHDHDISPEDMRRLLRDGKRVKKLVDRPSLTRTQRTLLGSMYDAHRLSTRQWIVVVVAVVTVAASLITYFSIRAGQYRSLLKEAHRLEESLDTYEKRITAARNEPGFSEDELQKLVGEFQQKQNVFSELRAQLKSSDFRRYYTDEIERELDAILELFGEVDYHVPPEMIERVRYHVGVYSGRMKATIARYLSRRDAYFPLFTRVLEQHNLPPELAYMAMLESGLDPQAKSRAGARGLWQLMPRTARGYKLTVNRSVDERTDPARSTKAAAEYLRDLFGIFGGKSSAMLAMAAYNAGEGRVMGALKKVENPMLDRDFWYLYRMGYLAEETNEYIPRILALMVIDRNRERYGFTADLIAAASDSSTLAK